MVFLGILVIQESFQKQNDILNSERFGLPPSLFCNCFVKNYNKKVALHLQIAFKNQSSLLGI